MGLNITVASKFNPFTYDDYIKPYKENIDTYFKNYRDTENKLTDLGTKLETLDYIIESEPENSSLKSIYSNYKKELEKAAEALRSGWDQTDVQNYNKLKKMFAKDISPIATQYARRQKLEDEQRKARESKPSIYFSKKASEASLAEMIENPNWSYTSFVGDDITEAVQNMVSPISTILDQIFNYGNVEGYRILKQQYGITPDDVIKYYNGQEGPVKEYFDKVKDTVVKSYGINTWNDENALDTAYHYANIGIPKAIGKLVPQSIPLQKPSPPPGDSSASSLPKVTSYSMGVIQDDDRKDQVVKLENDWKSIAGANGVPGTGVTSKANEYRAKLKELGVTNFDIKYIEALANGAENSTEIAHDPLDGGYLITKFDWKGMRIQWIASKLYSEYQRMQQEIRPQAVHTTRNADGTSSEIGLYAPTVKSSMDTKIAYENARSNTDYTVYEPSFEDSTRKDILTKWVRNAKGDNIHMYEVGEAGQLEELNKDDKKSILTSMATQNGGIKEDVGIFLSPKNGIEVEYDGKRYVINNYSSTDLKIYSDLMTDTYKAVYDFDDKTLRDYLTAKNIYNSLQPEHITNSGKLSKTGLEFLNEGDLWVEPEDSRHKHAFVYVQDELVKIIADKLSGDILGIVPISTIIKKNQNTGPGLIMQKLASDIASEWHLRTTNKNLTTPPRGK